MSLGDQIKLIANATLDVIYPNNCNLCQTNLLMHEKFMCQSCTAELPFLSMATDQQKLNQLFWGRAQIESIHSLMIYQKGNNVRDLLQLLKYQNKTKLAQYLGELLGEKLNEKPNYHAIIPIPLHPKKLRARGFNQSKVIAEGIRKVINIPIQDDWIKRVHHNTSQTTVSKYDRWDNVRSIFELSKPKNFRNQHVLVIDDVLTTGATLESCIHLLNKIEGCKISVATLAARI